MPGNLKHQLYHQATQFLMIACYLFVVFGILALHESVVAAKNHIEYHFYGFALINALILGKVMLVAEDLHFANWFRENPPSYSVVCKSIAFTILFLVFDIVEEITVGVFKGKTIAESFPNIGGGSPSGIFFMGVIIAVLLIPFFAYREIGRVIGEGELRSLMFTRTAQTRVAGLASTAGATSQSRTVLAAPSGVKRPWRSS